MKKEDKIKTFELVLEFRELVNTNDPDFNKDLNISPVLWIQRRRVKKDIEKYFLTAIEVIIGFDDYLDALKYNHL